MLHLFVRILYILFLGLYFYLTYFIEAEPQIYFCSFTLMLLLIFFPFHIKWILIFYSVGKKNEVVLYDHFLCHLQLLFAHFYRFCITK